MAHATFPLVARPLDNACRQLQKTDGLPFASHLPEERITTALRRAGASFRNRIWTPAVTLWTFLSQCLDPDHSCRAAVARHLAWRVASGLPPCSPDNDAYCKARTRLPEDALAQLARDAGRHVLDGAEGTWLWKGRTVKVVDGAYVTMPDTPANQQGYPQHPRQKPGAGFPMMRLVVVFALAVGTALEAAMGRYQGKGTGETSLFRSLGNALGEGDVLLADRGFCSYWVVAAARACGADAVLRLNAGRVVDFRTGRRLGPGDKLTWWKRPPRPDRMSEEDYQDIPESMWVRVVRVRVRQRGYRTRELLVATTLLEPAAATAGEIADLYHARWQVELDLRSLKQTMQMDRLRGKTPEMVRKEVWVHLLAYNLLRGLLAESARGAGVRPRELSFKGAMQTVNAFLPQLARAGEAAEWLRLWREMLWAISHHAVGDRPGRYEPRAVKQRRKKYNWLNEPRAKARARLAKGG
jgi:hypothetical protein